MSTAIVRQEYRKGPNVTVKHTVSRGDGSNMFNSSETIHGNGNVNIVSDLITKDIVQTDKVNSVGGNAISDTQGSSSQWVNEATELSTNSNYKIVGDLSNIRHGFFKEADNAKLKLAAMRSGFNDDRNISDLIPNISLTSIPGDIISNISVVEKNTVMMDDIPKIPAAGNIFTAIASLVATEISNMVAAYSKISAKSILKKAELSAKNTVEKQVKLIKSIEDLPESINKEKLKTAIAEGNLSTLFSSPSNEEKEKNSTYNKDEYEAEAVKVSKELISVERELK